LNNFSSIVTGIKVSPGSPPTFESNPVVYSRKVRFDISFSDMDDQKFICFIVYQLYDVDTWKERVRNRINEILIVGLEPDTVYFFKVSALIDDIETSCSKVVKIITAKEKIETIKLNDKREVDEETNFIKEYIKKFDPSLKNTKKNDRVNILVFGRIGSGKSAFINTLYSSITNEYSYVAISQQKEKSVTIKVSKYLLPGTNIYLWDVWGWDLDNYEVEFDYLLNGFLHNNFLMKSLEDDFITKMHETPKPTFKDSARCNYLYFYCIYRGY